jgi:hypothetical protein
MTRPHEDGEELMSYMDAPAAFAPAGGIQELSFDEIDVVNGGGRGDATANGAVVGAGAAVGYMTALRFASYGARIGIVGGAVGVIGGAIVGGAIGYVAFTIGSSGSKPSTLTQR